MTPSTNSKTPSPSPTTNKPAVEPVRVPEATVTAAPTPVETVKTEAVDAVDRAKSTTIISITVDEKLARQARFLAKARGVSISSLFTDAASVAIPVALKAALADIQGDLE